MGVQGAQTLLSLPAHGHQSFPSFHPVLRASCPLSRALGLSWPLLCPQPPTLLWLIWPHHSPGSRHQPLPVSACLRELQKVGGETPVTAVSPQDTAAPLYCSSLGSAGSRLPSPTTAAPKLPSSGPPRLHLLTFPDDLNSYMTEEKVASPHQFPPHTSPQKTVANWLLWETPGTK